MERLNPTKLHTSFTGATTAEKPELPRRYTLTHSDRTGDLFLSVGNEYNNKQISGFYTRLMRDEVLAELSADESGTITLSVYCHVSGGLSFGPARWRYSIFHAELSLVLEAIRYGDRVLFENEPTYDDVPVIVNFKARQHRFNGFEEWGKLGDYR